MKKSYFAAADPQRPNNAVTISLADLGLSKEARKKLDKMERRGIRLARRSRKKVR
jgi:hypothetical protein